MVIPAGLTGIAGSRRRYGLNLESGLIVNYKLVASTMQLSQVHGVPKRRSGKRNLIAVRTTSDLVNRDFSTTGPNQLWVTDITEHPTRESHAFSYVDLDAYSRKAVGWSIDRIADAAVVNSALNMAEATRSTTGETIIHAYHGAQFTSWAFPSNVRNYGLKLSLCRVGDCFDNAIDSNRSREECKPNFSTANHGQPLLNSAWRWPITWRISITAADATHHWLCSHQPNTKYQTKTCSN